MQSFITLVIQDLLVHHKITNLLNYKIVLPSKRAGVFFKSELKNQLKKATFLPKIISIEDLINEISEIELINNVTLQFEFYKIYLKHTPKNKTIAFEQFLTWSTILLQDINELDRHLIDVKYFFNYLADINRLEKQFLKNEKTTELSKNHFNFFNLFSIYYYNLYKEFISQNRGYQGLLYREAVSKVDTYIKRNKQTKIIFVGFNALNKAEEIIFTKILDAKIGDIYFDVDQFFIDKNLPYTTFINKYKTNWNYYNINKFKTITNSFTTKKNISIIGAPKNITILKETGILLKKISTDNYKNAALILANENLLTTALNSLPNEVLEVNITMGYPLKQIDLSNVFKLIFKLHQNRKKFNSDKFYYKDVLSVLQHHSILKIVDTGLICEAIINNNYNFITIKQLLKLADKSKTPLITLLFSDFNDVSFIINNCIKIIEAIKNKTNNKLETEYLNRFYELFQQLNNLNKNYKYIDNLNSLQSVFNLLLNTETLSFKGEPLTGLQIMGMLETRVLDFETVIITSVNEGFLPSGRTSNSFIPFDVKREFNLPTHKEKDAIFAYHFYRLIQKAKNIYLLYNTETDDFGSGEQSRFITQLEILQEKLPNLTLTKTIVSPKLNNEKQSLITIKKSEVIQGQLKTIFAKGISPTTLTNYIYNPIAFYKNKILKIASLNKIEENIAANTFGTVIHKTLEDLYKPFINVFLTQNNLIKMQKDANELLLKHFNDCFLNGDMTTGKNLLVFEISKQYIKNFLLQELNTIKTGKSLKILHLEFDLDTTITVNNMPYAVKLFGQADRIDQLDGTIRIIDYKTSKVEQKDLKINDWSELTTNYNYHKSFQVLMYAYIFTKKYKIDISKTSLETGVISFKNLKKGFLKVNKTNVNIDDLIKFESELKQLIFNIYNPKNDFIENVDLPF